MRQELRRAIGRALIAGALAIGLLTGGGVLAQDPHSGGGTGQPNQSCQDFGQFPNLNVPGFNTNGFNNVATAHYAGSQPQNSKNTHSVSQYDVACFQQSTH